MTKQILPNELAEIVTGLLIKPELLGELDSREAHQAFMLDITYGQIIMLKPGQTRDRKLSSTRQSETLTEQPCKLCLLSPHKKNLSVLLLLNE